MAIARSHVFGLRTATGSHDKLPRRPADVPKSTVKKVGVLGAGMLGSGIAYVAAISSCHMLVFLYLSATTLIFGAEINGVLRLRHRVAARPEENRGLEQQRAAMPHAI